LSNAQVQDLDQYQESGAYTDLERTVLRFAEQWTSRGKVDGEVVAMLGRELSATQLVVLAATVALANWTGRFNETFGVELP
jgi:alkylhydroperoxidase family enzyme